MVTEISSRWPEHRHTAVFYQSPGQLTDILVPFFKEGLERGQRCLWLVSPALRLDDARSALQSAVSDIQSYIQKGQLEFVAAEEWYTEAGTFMEHRAVEAMEKRRMQTKTGGYASLRASGDTSWLQRRDWPRFQDYEFELEHRSLSEWSENQFLCAYSFECCRSSDLVEVLCRHGASFVSNSGKWESHLDQGPGETSGGPLWDTLAATLKDPLIEMDVNGVILRCNPTAETFSGYEQAEVLRMPLYLLIDSEDQSQVAFSLYQLAHGTAVRDTRVLSRRRDGYTTPVSLSILPVLDHKNHSVSRAFAVFQSPSASSGAPIHTREGFPI